MEMIRKVLPWAISLIVGLALAELALGILPVSFTHMVVQVPFAHNSLIGFTRVPNWTGELKDTCFEAKPISINAQGFRDAPWPPSLKGGVAILGDSFMEGMVVGDNETTAARARAALGVPLANASVASFGTSAELATYRSYIQPLQPSVVALFIYPENDYLDSYCPPEQGASGTVSKVCAVPEGSDSFVLNKNVFQGWGRSPIKDFLQEHVRLFMLARALKGRLAAVQDGPPDIMNGSATSSTEAWETTRRLLAAFDAETRAAGSHLVVFLAPSLLAVAPETGDNALVPAKGIEEAQEVRSQYTDILHALNIPMVDLRSKFIEYRDKYALPYPYFSYPCEGHWNPIGHYIAAKELSMYLENMGILLIPEENKVLAEVPELTPQEILGEKRFKEIYNLPISTTHE